MGERSGLVLRLIIISDKHTSKEATKLHLESYFQDCPHMEEGYYCLGDFLLYFKSVSYEGRFELLHFFF